MNNPNAETGSDHIYRNPGAMIATLFTSLFGFFLISGGVGSLLMGLYGYPVALVLAAGLGCCVGAVYVFRTGKRMGVLVFSDRFVVRTFLGKISVVKRSEIVQARIHLGPNNSLFPRLTISTSQHREFTIYSSISRWDDLVKEVEALAPDKLKNDTVAS